MIPSHAQCVILSFSGCKRWKKKYLRKMYFTVPRNCRLEKSRLPLPSSKKDMSTGRNSVVPSIILYHEWSSVRVVLILDKLHLSSNNANIDLWCKFQLYDWSGSQHRGHTICVLYEVRSPLTPPFATSPCLSPVKLRVLGYFRFLPAQDLKVAF